MKKIFIFIIVIVALLVSSNAFAQSAIHSDRSLQFENVTNTSVIVRFIKNNNDEFTDALQNRFPIKIKYRPWMCGDDDSSAICTAIYIEPNVATLNYDSNGNLIPITLTNLQPNTKYRVWVGKDISALVRCIQAPCIADVWSDQNYQFTTRSLMPLPTPIVQILTQKLYFGVRGTQVNILENFLASQGYMSSYIDTYFGTVTHTAVMQFQASHGLKADGVVGPATRSIINSILNSNQSYTATTTTIIQ